jgi:hypothetical protein
MNALLTALMVWISSVTGLEVPEPPTIKYAEPLTIHRLANGPDSTPDESYTTIAFYDAAAAQIWIPRGQITDVVYASYIVHELVHHMQWRSARYPTYRCIGEIEAEAYRVQQAFLQIAGRDIHKDVGVGPLLLFALTTCAPAQEQGR